MHVRAARIEDADDIARVHVETWKTTYCGILPDEYLAKLDSARRAARLRKMLAETYTDQYNLVAETSEGRIVGFAWGGRNREDIPEFDSELYAIYVLQEYQGKGYGKALIRALGEKLLEQGYGSMILWVLSQNPWRRFYESLGGACMQSRKIEIGEVLLDEVAYAWRDLASLVDSLPKVRPSTTGEDKAGVRSTRRKRNNPGK